MIEITSDHFLARLFDLTEGTEVETEEAEIPLSTLSDQNRSKIKLGSVFHWVIGFEKNVRGGRRYISEFVFRQGREISQSDLDEGRQWASDVIRALDL